MSGNSISESPSRNIKRLSIDIPPSSLNVSSPQSQAQAHPHQPPKSQPSTQKTKGSSFVNQPKSAENSHHTALDRQIGGAFKIPKEKLLSPATENKTSDSGVSSPFQSRPDSKTNSAPHNTQRLVNGPHTDSPATDNNKSAPPLGSNFKIAREKLISPSSESKPPSNYPHDVYSNTKLSSTTSSLAPAGQTSGVSTPIYPNMNHSMSTGPGIHNSAAPSHSPILTTTNNNAYTADPSAQSTNTKNPGASASSSAVLNKSVISNLNKSLKAKQKIISGKEPHPKNSSLISEIVNTSPKSSAFPNNISTAALTSNSMTHTSSNASNTNHPVGRNISNAATNSSTPDHTALGNSGNKSSEKDPKESVNNGINLNNNIHTNNTNNTNVNTNPSGNNPASAAISTPTNDNLQTVPTTLNNQSSSNVAADSSTVAKMSKSKQKKLASQNSTRTDFFAAKLASAVDDVESSDSDETFVYENNNITEYDDGSNENNSANVTGAPSTPLPPTSSTYNLATEHASDSGAANILAPKDHLHAVHAPGESQHNATTNNHTDTAVSPERTVAPHNAPTSAGTTNSLTSAPGPNLASSIAVSSTINSSNREDSLDKGASTNSIRRAESIRSMHSSKNNPSHSPTTFRSMAYSQQTPSTASTTTPSLPFTAGHQLHHPQPYHSPLENSYNSNHYLDNILKSRPPTNRQGSTFSIPSSIGNNNNGGNFNNNDDERAPPESQSNAQVNQVSAGKTLSTLSQSPSGRYASSNFPHGIIHHNPASSFGINYHTSRAQSINDDERYSYDEVDDDAEIDDVSTDGDYFNNNPSNLNNSSGAAATVTNNPDGAGIGSGRPDDGSNNNSNGSASAINQQSGQHKPIDTTTITSKATSKKNYKSSNNSSKLRSTTSKLFDKKGSQPRRYSIIPDDFDIEDFDDELIYYDNNNIRFPYNGTNNNSGVFNENSPLISQGHGGHSRIPHYRSLNLSLQGGKKPLNLIKNKRYMSMGPSHTAANPNTSPPPNHPAPNDMFPFSYPDPHQNYYYDLDEYDEESQLMDRKSFNGNNGDGTHRHPHLSPSNGHFFLPRKISKGNMQARRVDCVKSFIYTLVSIVCILSIGFISGFVLASTKDLTNVSIVSIENTLVSQDELIFNVVVEAFNPGWFTVTIEDVELDIFAKSGYLPDIAIEDIAQANEDMDIQSTVETVLLGSVFTLESALSFEGGFFVRDPKQQTGAIKLPSPGKNLTNFVGMEKRDHATPISALSKSDNSTEPDNSKKWEIISKNPFDLIIRGIFKYNLPMTKNVKSVVVNKVGFVDPNQDGLKKSV